jgi:O-antigen/teichoic acid export membrane protein
VLLFAPVVLGILGAESYGLVGFQLVLSGIAGFLDLGLSLAVLRELAVGGNEAAGGHSRRTVLRTLELSRWALGALGAGVIIGFTPWIAHSWIKAVSLHGEVVERSVRLMAGAFLMQFVATFYHAALYGVRREISANVISALFEPVRWLAGTGVLLAAGPRPDFFIAAQAGAAAAMMLVSRFILSLGFERTEAEVRFSGGLLRSLVAYSGAVTGGSLLAAVLSQINRIVASALLPLSSFAAYSIATSLYLAALSAYEPLGRIFVAAFANAEASEAAGRLRRTYHDFAATLAALVFPGAITLALLSREALLVWTRNEALSAEAAPAVTLLMVAVMFNAISNSSVTFLFGTGRPVWLLRVNLALAAVLGSGAWWITARLGILGAALLPVFQNATYAVTLVPLVHARWLRGEGRRWLSNDVLWPIVSSLFVVGLLRSALVMPTNRLHLAGVLTAIGGVAYAATAGTLWAVSRHSSPGHLEQRGRSSKS